MVVYASRTYRQGMTNRSSSYGQLGLYASCASAQTSGAWLWRKAYSPLYLSSTEFCRICVFWVYPRFDETSTASDIMCHGSSHKNQ